MRSSLLVLPFSFAALAAMVLLAACGSGGSSNAGAGGAGGNAGAGGAPGPCVAAGTWTLTYAKSPEASCVPGSDTMTLTQDAAGALTVAFAGDDTMPMDMCGAMPPNAGTYTTSASASADGCELTLTSHLAYCYSGEEQCEDRVLTLDISGDAATGTLTYTHCWCPDVSGPPVTVSATAKRAP